jgi:hypothetical protein
MARKKKDAMIPCTDPPFDEIRIGVVRAAFWKNETSNSSDPWYSLTLSRLYKNQEGAWQSSGTFRQRDLPSLVKVISDSFLWFGSNVNTEAFVEPLRENTSTLKAKNRQKVSPKRPVK